jgi:hypothetical protein
MDKLCPKHVETWVLIKWKWLWNVSRWWVLLNCTMIHGQQSIKSFLRACCVLNDHIIFPSGPDSPSGPGPPHCWTFEITLRHTLIDRTPLDEWSVQRRDLYRTTYNTPREKYPCPRRYSNLQPQQERCIRPTPYIAPPPGSAMILPPVLCENNFFPRTDCIFRVLGIQFSDQYLTLSLLMYIYGAPSKARNLTSYTCIYGRDFLLAILLLEPCISLCLLTWCACAPRQ